MGRSIVAVVPLTGVPTVPPESDKQTASELHSDTFSLTFRDWVSAFSLALLLWMAYIFDFERAVNHGRYIKAGEESKIIEPICFAWMLLLNWNVLKFETHLLTLNESQGHRTGNCHIDLSRTIFTANLMGIA